MLRKGIITLFLFMILPVLILAEPALAQIPCKDVKYGNPDYSDKMDELAQLAKLPDNYWNRYHEDVVSNLCSGNIKEIDGLLDSGFVKPQEVQNIAKVLGKTYKQKQRSESGQKYEVARRKFTEMGACNACSDNIAQYYTKKPNSTCGKLAKQALDGDPAAIRKLVAFPDYCRWSY